MVLVLPGGPCCRKLQGQDGRSRAGGPKDSDMNSLQHVYFSARVARRKSGRKRLREAKLPRQHFSKTLRGVFVIVPVLPGGLC